MRRDSWKAPVLLFSFSFFLILILKSPLPKPAPVDHAHDATLGGWLNSTSSTTAETDDFWDALLNESFSYDAQTSGHLEKVIESRTETLHNDSDETPHYTVTQDVPGGTSEPLVVAVRGRDTEIDISRKERDDSPSHGIPNNPHPLFSSINSTPRPPPFLITTRKAFLSRSSPVRPWGSHPLPPVNAFTWSPETHWVAYFHDQAVAAVHLRHDGAMLNCTVQEVIEVWEQRAALEYLGRVMPLEPMELPAMVHLIALCGALNSPPPDASGADSEEVTNLWSQGSALLQGILPGTLWCGRSDQATYYQQLGRLAKLDSCCRTHDHCPVKLLPLASRYGLTNLSFKTKSHCLCDLEFFRCLKAASSPLAAMVGELYFNFLKMDCLNPVPSLPLGSAPGQATPQGSRPRVPDTFSTTRVLPERQPSGSLSSGSVKKCLRRDSYGRCRKWLLPRRSPPGRLRLTATTLTF